MPVEWLRRLIVVLVLVVVLLALAVVGSPGATYRANTAFATCIEEKPAASDEEAFETFIGCNTTHCPDTDPSRVAMIGLWLYVQLDAEAPSCHEPPDFLNIIIP